MKKFILLSFALSFVLYSCGPSVEGQAGAWKTNLDELNQLKKEYPQFAKMIDDNIADAKKVYDSVEDLKDEDAKAEIMQEANALLSAGCVGDLKNMKGKIADVRTKIEDLKKFRRDKSEADLQVCEIVLTDANNAIANAEQSLKSADSASPCDVITNAFAGVKSSYDDIVSTMTSIEQKLKDAEAKKNDSIAKANGTTTDAAATIKCEHCGVTAEKSPTGKCASCGAPYPAK
jgi:DNA repair exonuclease SbcCD ATPase subunit